MRAPAILGLALVLLGRDASAQLRITTDPTPVPIGSVGQPYALRFVAGSGMEPAWWSVTQGTIPPGLRLESTTGVLSGVPLLDGQFGLEISVSSEVLGRGQTSVIISIDSTPDQTGLHITVPNSVRLEFEQPSDFELTAAGGDPPYLWQIRGDLPAGLRLEGARVRGTATASVATRVILTVTDRQAATDSKTVDFDARRATTPSRSTTSRNTSASSRQSSGCTCTPAGASVVPGLALVLLALRRRRFVR